MKDDSMSENKQKLINIKKGNDITGTNDESINYIQKMQNDFESIIDLLCSNNKNFDVEQTVRKLESYMCQYKRLPYSNLSNIVFCSDEQILGNMDANIQKLIESTVDKKELHAPISKLWDHFNLARGQNDAFRQSRDEYNKIFDENLKGFSSDIKNDITSEMISLLAIFTALAFIAFGGISTIDNILNNAKDIPILKLICIGCIWCFCFMNLVFAFMYHVTKMLKSLTKQDISESINDMKKYVRWCNFIVLSIFAFVCWFLFIDSYSLDERLINNFKGQKNICEKGIDSVKYFV